MESVTPWTVPADRIVVGVGNCNTVPQAGEPAKRSKAHPTILTPSRNVNWGLPKLESWKCYAHLVLNIQYGNRVLIVVRGG